MGGLKVPSISSKLYPLTLTRGVETTLTPGDLPLEFGDLEVEGAQRTAVRALVGGFDA